MRSAVLVVVVMWMLACTSERLPPPAAETATPDVALPVAWTVAVTTSGGFVGHGLGRVVISSDDAAGREQPSCRKPRPAELDRLRRAVGKANPELWAASYTRPKNPEGCCDQFRYTLTLTMRGSDGAERRHSTFWYSEMSESLPPEVRDVFDAAWTIRKHGDERCKAKAGAGPEGSPRATP